MHNNIWYYIVKKGSEKMKEFYSLNEVAEILGFSIKTVREWVRLKKINYVKILGNIRVSKEELERLKKGE